MSDIGIIERNKQRFTDIYKSEITRDGADKLLDFLLSKNSDFFIAPASARYHLSHDGGLCEHSLNVYDCLRDYVSRSRVNDVYGLKPSSETVALVSLLHDVCKINTYARGTRNVKDENGVWQKVPTYEYADAMPYGHGEKSVYIIGGYLKLSREEAFAIRYHMGFANAEDIRNVSAAFGMYPLALALSFADMEATFCIESNNPG